jgi:hypothetical protein
MMAVAWRRHVTESGGCVAIEGKMMRVLWLLGLCIRDGLEEGGKEKAGCNTLVCFLRPFNKH